MNASRGVGVWAVLSLAVACVPDGPRSPTEPSGLPSRPPGAGGTMSRPGAPMLGPPVIAAVRPPALTGGTLLIRKDGRTAVAADPGRDLVAVVDLEAEQVLARVALAPGDEPGRVVDAGPVVLVALRRGGAVVSIDPATGVVLGRAAVCPAPRGIAFEEEAQRIHVACAGGELVTLGAADLVELRRVQLDRDLRDVVASDGQLFVSRFRSAELLVLRAADLSLVSRAKAPGSAHANRPLASLGAGLPAAEGRAADPVVAWRLRGRPGGGVLMLHQEATNRPLGVEAGGYGGFDPCTAPVGGAIARFASNATADSSLHLGQAALPVDFDLAADGKKIAFISVGGTRQGRGPVFVSAMDALFGGRPECGNPPPPPEPIELRQPIGDPVAVAFDGRGRVVVQTREPARIEIVSHQGGAIKIADSSGNDSGYTIFHMTTGIGIACASCHPEGGDDGRVWRFDHLGPRRTQNLRGGIGMTAPFHWDGGLKDLGQLMTDVFTNRMRGPTLDRAHIDALGSWIDALPVIAPSAPPDPAAVARGGALFVDATVACSSCHRGPAFTDNSSRVVGRGVLTQVPGLRGLAFRAPYMHDGCAPTLLDRFTPACGGGDAHGVTSQLSREQLLDLVAFLDTL